MFENTVSFKHPWKEKSFEIVGEVIVGGTPRTSEEKFWGGLVPWMASGDVHLKIIRDVPIRITYLGLQNSNAVLVPPPSVAIALAGQGKTRGTVALVSCELCTNQSIALLKCNSDVLETLYLLHNLSFRYDEMRSRSSGGGRAGLTKKILEAIPIPLPPKPIQVKIAEVLSTVDQAIEQTEALIEKQQRIKTGLMQDLLTRGIDENGNIRSEETHEFKDSPLGRIPVEWDVVNLRSCYSDPSRNGLYKPKEFYGHGYKMVHMPQMFRDFYVDIESCENVQVSTDEVQRFELQSNDLLIARRSLVFEGAGRCSLVPKLEETVTFESSIIRVRLNKEVLNSFYAHYYLNSENGYRMRIPFIRQVAVSGVSGEDVGQYQIIKPQIEEQEEIVKRLNKIQLFISDLKAMLNKQCLLKTGLMQDLITGKVSVEPLLEEFEKSA